MGSKLLSVTRDRNLTRSTPLLSQPKQPMAVMRILRVCTLLSLLCYSEAMFKRDVRTDFWACGTTEEKCVYEKRDCLSNLMWSRHICEPPNFCIKFLEGLSFLCLALSTRFLIVRAGVHHPKTRAPWCKTVWRLGRSVMEEEFPNMSLSLHWIGQVQANAPPFRVRMQWTNAFLPRILLVAKKGFFSPKGSYFVPWYCIEIIYETFRTILSLGQFHSRTSIGDAVSKATSKAKSIVHRAEEAAEDFKDA